MRRELKLAFDELEKELLIIPPDDLFRFMGGFSTGSSSGGSSGLSADASIDEVVDYLRDIGMEFSEDSSGNYYFKPNDSSGNSIRLDTVTVTGFYSTGSSGSWDGGGTGASGFNSLLDMTVAYLGGYGHVFTGSNSNYTYVPNYTSNPINTEPGDPWKRDENGDLVVTQTNITETKDYIGSLDSRMDKVKLNMKQVIVKGKMNEDVIAYEVVSYVNANGVTITDVPDKYKSNCHGFAMGLNLWIDDPYNPNAQNVDTIHEDASFQKMMNMNYASDSLYSNVVSFYNGNTLAHTIRRDPITGEVWSKTDIDGIQHYSSMEEFYNGNDGKNGLIYRNLTQKFYKL